MSGEDEPGIVVGVDHDAAEDKIEDAPKILATALVFGMPENISRDDRLEG